MSESSASVSAWRFSVLENRHAACFTLQQGKVPLLMRAALGADERTHRRSQGKSHPTQPSRSRLWLPDVGRGDVDLDSSFRAAL